MIVARGLQEVKMENGRRVAFIDKRSVVNEEGEVNENEVTIQVLLLFLSYGVKGYAKTIRTKKALRKR